MTTVAVVGLGLLGGSVALAARAQGHAVVGHDSCEKTRRLALQRGVIDSAVGWQELGRADLLFIAVPVVAIGEALRALAPHLQKNAVAVDVGSAKANICRIAAEALGRKRGQFVAAHPVAGSEQSGLAAARANLFANKLVVLCDLPQSAAAAAERARAFWQKARAQTVEMDSAEHDKIFAVVSHLPHLLAFALMGLVGDHPQRDLLLRHTAAGFRDFTRIAASSPSMWRDICLHNTDNLRGALAGYQTQLAALAQNLQAQDGDALAAQFNKARELRQRLAAAPTKEVMP